jgi:hypothetical protein
MEGSMTEATTELIEEKDMPFPRTTLYRLRNRVDNPLPHYRIGRRIYYSKEHLDSLLKSCEHRGEVLKHGGEEK